MKANRFRSWTRLGVLWLTLGVACQKDPPLPACKNGECCGHGRVEFIRRVNGARAEYGGIVFNFQQIIGKAPSNQTGALTCPVQQKMITALKLKSNTIIDATGKVRLIDSTRAYPYRVWGIIYELPDMPGIAGPMHAIRLEKVEPVY